MYNKTKKGATSLIVTLFFTLLAGILVLSFVSIMLSNINESTNYNLSQSAYDSALAGIEDAKIMLLEYNNCMARNDTTSNRCKDIVAMINAEGSEDDCDIVRKALGRAEGENETLVRSDNLSSGVDASFDMAYTCVKVSMKVPNYLGTITKDTDTKVIPLRTHSAADPDASSEVSKVRIEWFSNDDFSTIVDNGLAGDYKTITSFDSRYTFDSNKVKAQDIKNGHNKFADVATLPPVLNVGLIQAYKDFRLSQFTMAYNDNRTNRGRLTLRPVYDASAIDGNGNIAVQTISKDAFPKSTKAASKEYNTTSYQDNGYMAVNSPRDIKCYNKEKIGMHSYACSVVIELPYTYDGRQAKDTFRYLTLSAPYPDPDISFSVTLLNGENKVVDFIGVQSGVDSTGRANDLFRRIDARVELIDIGYPFPKYTVGIYCDKNTENCGNTGNLIKNYRATFNCWDINNGADNSEDCDDFKSDGLNSGGFDS